MSLEPQKTVRAKVLKACFYVFNLWHLKTASVKTEGEIYAHSSAHLDLQSFSLSHSSLEEFIYLSAAESQLSDFTQSFSLIGEREANGV